MRCAVLALSFTSIFIVANRSVAGPAGNTRATGLLSDRAARAEQRSRLETTGVCRGCGVSLRANKRTVTVPSLTVQARATIRSGSIWTPIPALPLTSRAEAQVQALNDAIALQQQWRLFQQQTQFEINQLRSELHRDHLFARRDYLFP
jgi:hypothetical protein